MSLNENKLKDFSDLLEQERDPRIVLLVKTMSSSDSPYQDQALRAVLNILGDQYPQEVADILEEYSESPDPEITPEITPETTPETTPEFSDEDLYHTDLLFANYDMGHQEILDYQFEMFLQNPEAINSLLILIAQNKDLDFVFLDLLQDPDQELSKLIALINSGEEVDLDLSDSDDYESPSPSPSPSNYSGHSHSKKKGA